MRLAATAAVAHGRPEAIPEAAAAAWVRSIAQLHTLELTHRFLLVEVSCGTLGVDRGETTRPLGARLDEPETALDSRRVGVNVEPAIPGPRRKNSLKRISNSCNILCAHVK